MARRKKSKAGLSSKLKGIGMVAVALGFVAIVSWGVVQKKQKAAYRSELSEKEAKELTFKRKLHEAELKALPPDELAEKTNTLFLEEGARATFSGYLLRPEQNIACDGCLKFQEEYEPTLKKAIDQKRIAFEDRDKAIRAKGKWKIVAFVAVGVTTGLILERTLR